METPDGRVIEATAKVRQFRQILFGDPPGRAAGNRQAEGQLRQDIQVECPHHSLFDPSPTLGSDRVPA